MVTFCCAAVRACMSIIFCLRQTLIILISKYLLLLHKGVFRAKSFVTWQLQLSSLALALCDAQLHAQDVGGEASSVGS